MVWLGSALPETNSVSSRRKPGSTLRSFHAHRRFSHLEMDSGLRRNDIVVVIGSCST